MADSSAEAASALIAHHFPSLHVERLQLLPHVGWGGDSDAWLVNDVLVFRIPRAPEVAAQLAVEVCLLPALARRLPLSIPRFEYVARDTPTGAPRFVGYRAIAGEPLTPALVTTLAPLDQAALGTTLGGFLSALHTYPVARARACGVAELQEPERTRALFDHVRSAVYPRLAPPIRAWADHLFGDALADPRLWDYLPVVTHGDLSGDHILFDPAHQAIAGVIDFGDMAIGDAVGDFVSLAEYEHTFFEAGLDGYTQPLGAAARDRLAFYRRRLPFIALAWGVEHDDTTAVGQGMTLLRAVIAAGPAARP